MILRTPSNRAFVDRTTFRFSTFKATRKADVQSCFSSSAAMEEEHRAKAAQAFPRRICKLLGSILLHRPTASFFIYPNIILFCLILILIYTIFCGVLPGFHWNIMTFLSKLSIVDQRLLGLFGGSSRFVTG